jgi:hypothetical protein
MLATRHDSIASASGHGRDLSRMMGWRSREFCADVRMYLGIYVHTADEFSGPDVVPQFGSPHLQLPT